VNLNPLAWPLAGKLAAIGASTAVLAGAATTVISTGHANTAAEPGVATYLCTHGTYDTLLQWRDNGGGHLSGTYQVAELSGQTPTETVSSNSTDLSGTLTGNAITLSIGQSQPLYGTFTGSQLAVNVPQQDGTIQATTCTRASIADWNTTVDTLNTQAGSDNNQALQQEHQASQASANAAMQQQADNDITTLVNFSLSGDLGQLSTDMQKVDTDLAAENTAAAQGQDGPGNLPGSCYNLTGVVSYDATSVVGYDASSVFGYDLQQNLQPQISSGRSAISTVQSDISNLQAAGLSVPDNAQTAISAVQSTISDAISTANSDIAHVNSDVATAYSMANNMATGNCQGDGAGSPPSIQDIS
jgi:hypothetical protein